MKERIQSAELKVYKKVAELSPVRIGLALGVIANLPLIAIAIGGAGI